MSASVRLCRGGLRLVDGQGHTEEVPLRAGALHYFRTPRSHWRPALEAIRRMELRVVETYVPWRVHEQGPPEALRYDFTGELDLAEFVREAGRAGLLVFVRPGPHVNGELTDFGLPERIIWDPACQARSSRGNPVLLPVPPRSFPIPSYASRAFLEQTARWYQVVGAQLAPLVWPDGPLVLVQVDNEGAQYFRDSLYDQDWHPDALRCFHEQATVRRLAIDEPRTRFDPTSPEGLTTDLLWAETHEVILAEAFAHMSAALAAAGLGALPTLHNFPMGECGSALVSARVRRVSGGHGIDCVGLDYYHPLGDRRGIARRTAELTVSCEALDVPTVALEMGVGAPPYFPPFDAAPAKFTLLCAMAYGLRGFNLYMAVDRDRWYGAPVGHEGSERQLGDFYRKLGRAWDRLGFSGLRRKVSVLIVVPRSFRRLTRVMNAFGPISQMALRTLGVGLRESLLEVDDQLPQLMEEAELLVGIERALDRLSVPWAQIDSSDLPSVLGSDVGDDFRLILVPTRCGLEPEAIDALASASERGTQVACIPGPPERDDLLRPLAPSSRARLQSAVMLEAAALVDSVRGHELLAGLLDPLGAICAPRLEVLPQARAASVPPVAIASGAVTAPSVAGRREGEVADLPEVGSPSVTVFHDGERPRLLFLIHEGRDATNVRLVWPQGPGPRRGLDVFSDEVLDLAGALALSPQSVRVVEVLVEVLVDSADAPPRRPPAH